MDMSAYLPLYFSESERRFDDAERALQQGDRQAFLRAAHTLRGMNLTMGFAELAEQATELEEAAERAEEEDLRRGLRALRAAVLRLRGEPG